MHSTEKKYYQYIEDNKLYKKSRLKNLSYYLSDILFKNIDLKDKVVLDIGAGNGVYSFYALAKGAKKLVCIEPEFEGSRSNYISSLKKFRKFLNRENDVIISTDTFQNFESEMKFDIVLMHYSVNHIDEENCIILESSKKSQKIYHNYFQKIYNSMSNDGDLIITDTSKYNFFNFFGMKNPFVPTIEWEKHQSPYVWSKYLKKVKFSTQKIQWTGPMKLRKLHFILNNAIFLYLTTSLFRLHMKK